MPFGLERQRFEKWVDARSICLLSKLFKQFTRALAPMTLRTTAWNLVSLGLKEAVPFSCLKEVRFRAIFIMAKIEFGFWGASASMVAQGGRWRGG